FSKSEGVQFTKAHPASRAASAYSSDEPSDPDDIRLTSMSAPDPLRWSATFSRVVVDSLLAERWGGTSRLDNPGPTSTPDSAISTKDFATLGVAKMALFRSSPTLRSSISKAATTLSSLGRMPASLGCQSP